MLPPNAKFHPFTYLVPERLLVPVSKGTPIKQASSPSESCWMGRRNILAIPALLARSLADKGWFFSRKVTHIFEKERVNTIRFATLDSRSLHVKAILSSLLNLNDIYRERLEMKYFGTRGKINWNRTSGLIVDYYESCILIG